MPPVFSRVRDRSRDKALLIGFEYRNAPNAPIDLALTGVHDEIMQFRKHLLEYQGYTEQNVKVILDGDRKYCRGPTVMDVVSRFIPLLVTRTRLTVFARSAKYPGWSETQKLLKARDGSDELDKKDEGISYPAEFFNPCS
ncbi:hypothetical protein EIP86_002746 [Pleurotus ostreatoroseus]|nr:hypothetical protein EIP86_002746 [Pleurotus ostreatoroseus]